MKKLFDNNKRVQDLEGPVGQNVIIIIIIIIISFFHLCKNPLKIRGVVFFLP